MQPFDAYPGKGQVLLGRPKNNDNCRHGYGLDLQRRTGQTTCGYCGLSLIDEYAHWLLLSVDHVVPRGQAVTLGIDAVYFEDVINLVLCCAGCNGFGNRYTVPLPAAERGPWDLPTFVALRDTVFAARSIVISARRATELAFYQSKPWERQPQQTA